MDIKIKNDYYAYLSAESLQCWGFYVYRDKVKAFTVDLAKEILDFANKKYTEVFPDRKSEKFNYINLDMSDYVPVDYYTPKGDEITKKRVGKKVNGRYWLDKNLLRIYEDGVPIYENNNGIICHDSVAIVDG